MPTTLHLHASDPADVARAAALLRQGRLVAFPTETVYGLGAHALDRTAVAGIFAAKGRPAWDPLITHIADLPQLDELVTLDRELQARVLALAARFWPGPLTLLLPRTPAVPDAVTAGRPLVGIRLPAHPLARALLHAAGVPVAAPSANRFGHTSPTTAGHVLADLDGRIDAVLDGGPAEVGVESTVLDPATMTLFRPGAITPAELTAVTGLPVQVYTPPASHSERPEALPSPGVGIRHYAPKARLVLVQASPEALAGAVERAILEGERPGALLPAGWRAAEGAEVFAWGAWEDSPELARRLFAGLRALDVAGVSVIFAPLPEPGGLNDALRDRLEKAARTH